MTRFTAAPTVFHSAQAACAAFSCADTNCMIILDASLIEPHPVKRTEKKYKVFPASSHSLLAALYAVRPSSCFSIGVNTPRLRCTRLVL